MTMSPSAAWFDVFPGPRIPDVLAYVADTWDFLQNTYPGSVCFSHDETALTDNLCEALEDHDRRLTSRMDCDFQPETWELRRGPDGRTTRIARADIRVILGAPGTPHLVMEFKKLDGSADSKWRYCFDGMNRFVDGKYAQGHAFGVMCGFSPNDLDTEATDLAGYISKVEYCQRLSCIPDEGKRVVTIPSLAAPPRARFDTNHHRSSCSSAPIKLLHVLIPCANSPTSSTKPARRRRRTKT
ncbi:Uncharacterised protein [Pseudomonas aeruginosa]|nr:Uncharacterised protein [Pseudomonas aeruginosa]